ncbi:MAG: ABC transporter permease subunit [Bacillota bacterium]|nr:ABC transporter permease subunit [Bacillota bacterium]
MEVRVKLKDQKAKDFFRNKRLISTAIIGFLILTAWLSSNLIDFDFLLIFEKFSKAASRFVSLYLPANFKNLADLLEGVWVTFILAVASGIVGSFFAYLTALSMSTKTSKNLLAKNLLRFLSTLIRNIPTTIWAIVLLISFWYGEFLAFLVMTLGTFGFNARVFADVFDEASSQSIEALNAVGANRFQVICQSVFPESWPSIISWTLYAIETNIRDSVVVGMLAGGGIGHLIDMHRNFRRFDQLTAAVILVVLLVLAFDKLSVFIREKLQA